MSKALCCGCLNTFLSNTKLPTHVPVFATGYSQHDGGLTQVTASQVSRTTGLLPRQQSKPPRLANFRYFQMTTMIVIEQHNCNMDIASSSSKWRWPIYQCRYEANQCFVKVRPQFGIVAVFGGDGVEFD